MPDLPAPDMARSKVLITGGTGLLALNWACAIRETHDVVALEPHRVGAAQKCERVIAMEAGEVRRDAPPAAPGVAPVLDEPAQAEAISPRQPV